MNERWTSDADLVLRNEALDGQDPVKMAASLGRSEGAVQARLRRLGLTDRAGRLLTRSDMEWAVSLEDRDSLGRFAGFLQRFLPDTVTLVAESASRLILRILEPQTQTHVVPDFHEASEPPPPSKAYQALREWRKEKARELAVSPFIVAWNSHLEEIASTMPASLEELQRVRGVRASFLQKYGAEVLEVLGSLNESLSPPVAPKMQVPDTIESHSVVPATKGAPVEFPKPVSMALRIEEFQPSSANEALVEALPPSEFSWGQRPKDPDVLDHWRSFAVLWMKLLEGEVKPGNEAERRVMEFLPVWEGRADRVTETVWERALHEYAATIAKRRGLNLGVRMVFRDPRQEFFRDDQIGRLGPYSG